MITQVQAKELQPGDVLWIAGHQTTVRASLPIGFDFTDESGAPRFQRQFVVLSSGERQFLAPHQMFVKAL